MAVEWGRNKGVVSIAPSQPFDSSLTLDARCKRTLNNPFVCDNLLLLSLLKLCLHIAFISPFFSPFKNGFSSFL